MSHMAEKMQENKEESIKESLSEQSLVRKQLLLVITNSEDYGMVKSTIIRSLIKKFSGLYVGLNQPCRDIISALKNEGIDCSKLSFIDALSKKAGKARPVPNCSYTGGPDSLSELSIAIADEVSKRKPDFLLFDSVSTLLLYNSQNITEKFLHYLTAKIRFMNVHGIFICMDDEESKKMFPMISQFFDMVVDLT